MSEITYRSAGADMSVHNIAINILLRWSKEVLFCLLCLDLEKNSEPISYINSCLKKLCKV